MPPGGRMLRGTAMVGVFALGLASQAAAQTTTLSTREIDVGGRMMRVAVAGLEARQPDQPVVILESGAGGGLDAWQPVFGDIARLAPVLAYDRRGLGQSEEDTQPQTLRRVARSLHDLLDTLRISPPYALVGHSFGALYVRAFTELFPNEVAGYVFVEGFGCDSGPEEDAKPESGRTEARAPMTFPPIPPDTPPGMVAEIELVKREMLTDCGEGRTLRPKRDVPVAVIVASPPGLLESPEAVLRMRSKISNKADWALRSSRGLFIASGRVGHNVMKDDPALVLQAVRHILGGDGR